MTEVRGDRKEDTGDRKEEIGKRKEEKRHPSTISRSYGVIKRYIKLY